jgi:hypothetical protein
MAVSLSALHAGRPLPVGRFLVLISLRGGDDRRTIVRLEGLRQLKNPMTSWGIEPATFPACSIVPQPTMLPNVLHGLHRLGLNKTEIMYAVKWKGLDGKGF